MGLVDEEVRLGEQPVVAADVERIELFLWRDLRELSLHHVIPHADQPPAEWQQ